MQRAFVDTGAWFSFFVAGDPDHSAVAWVLEQWSGRLVTSDYVFDELVTLLRYRAGHESAVRAGNGLRGDSGVELAVLQLQDIEAAWRRFSLEADKRYSFTDCTSFAVMKRLKIGTAIATDRHFRQAGFAVLPTDR
jgi:predicted nucleic acid-binding protein